MFGRKKTNQAPELAADAGNEPVSSQRRRTLVIYKAKDGWRWRLWSTNGHIVADSGEAYGRRVDCRRAAERLAATAASAKIVESDAK